MRGWLAPPGGYDILPSPVGYGHSILRFLLTGLWIWVPCLSARMGEGGGVQYSGGPAAVRETCKEPVANGWSSQIGRRRGGEEQTWSILGRVRGVGGGGGMV